MGDQEFNIETAAAAIVDRLMPKVEERFNPITQRTEAVAAQIVELREQLAPMVRTQLQEMGLVDTEGAIVRPPAAPSRAAGTGLLGLLQPETHNPEAVGAKLDGAYASFGDFMRSVVRKGAGGGRDERLLFISEKGEIRADMSGNELATGGALVPEEFRAQLLTLGLEASRIRPLTMRLPMGSNTIRIPAIKDTDRSGGTVFGGIQGFWTKPGGTITESEPTFAQVALDAKGLKFYTELENELISDSFTSAEALVVRMIAMAEPWFFDQAVLGGSGAGEPKGIRNADAKVAVTRGTANTVKIADIASMYARMLPSSLGRAVWLVSPAVLAQLMQLESSGGAQVFWPDLTNGLRMRLGGNPVIISEHIPDLGSADDIMFVDFGFYLVGDRQAMSIVTSPHFRFQTDITAVRGVERLDGQPWVVSALTPANGGDTLSPIVGLAA